MLVAYDGSIFSLHQIKGFEWRYDRPFVQKYDMLRTVVKALVHTKHKSLPKNRTLMISKFSMFTFLMTHFIVVGYQILTKMTIFQKIDGPHFTLIFATLGPD